LEAELANQNEQMVDASQSFVESEKQARMENPELGRLYSELVKARLAYREALEGSATYTGAKKKNVDAMEAYSSLARERDALKKEISQ